MTQEEAEKNKYGLFGGNFSGANFSGANFFGANFSGANLSGADLSRANLSGADLSGANLSWANLSWANLSWATLSGANLFGANLFKANLFEANLFEANLENAKLPPISILPKGDIIGWKKLMYGVICKLKIPAEARRVNSTGRKCRAEFAIVLEGKGYGIYDTNFHYKPGATVYPDKYDPDFRVECSHGIHFFITQEEARAY